jgi:hypothetical protein
MTEPIIQPEYRVLLVYDIIPEEQQTYFYYMVEDFVPAMRKMGLYMIFVWEITYGDYPQRQLDFVCESADTLRAILTSPTFHEAEARLQAYTHDYRRKVVRFSDRLLQF